ncbi:hypothetical protein KKI24_02885 [bacterium]|nr:hypothetical protein [bacterium]
MAGFFGDWIEKHRVVYNDLNVKKEKTRSEWAQYYLLYAPIFGFLLSRRSLPRFFILFAGTLIGLWVWSSLYDWKPDALWLKDLIEKIPTSFGFFIVTLPGFIGLWVFRNNDKRTDHHNADVAQIQVLRSLKKEDLINTIKLLQDQNS